jgi:hypothetical protein
MVRTLEAAAAWVDEVGLALLFPKADVVLPSLWEQVNGSPADNWSIRDPEGTFVRWTEEMGFLWGAKDELPAQGLVCVGKHVARVATCVAPRVLPLLVAAREPSPPAPDEEIVVAAIDAEGPLTGPQLRDLTGLPKKHIDRLVSTLHRSLVLSNGHLVEQAGPWGAIAHDLLARKWRLPAHLPDRGQARAELARLVLERAGELTAADLAGPFGWRRSEAAALLEAVGEGREAEGFRIWARI